MYVYFIGAGEAIKVGVANDVGQRIREIQVGNSNKVLILHSCKFPSELEARRIEKEIHYLFHKTNLQGEWFQKTRFMMSYIDNIVQNGIESHLEWANNKYKEKYGDILNELKAKIEHDFMTGDCISAEKLEDELQNLLGTTLFVPERPRHLTGAIKTWVKEREQPFHVRDIFRHFDMTGKKERNVISAIISRFVNEGLIEKTGEKQAPYKRI